MGFLQYIDIFRSHHTSFPITGTFENPAGFASAQAVMFPYTCLLMVNKDIKRKWRLFACITAIMIFITVILSESRTGVISILSTTLVATVFYTDITLWINKNRWIWIIVTVVSLLGITILYSIKPDSANGRFFIWKLCFNIFSEHPLFGYGMDGFHKVYMESQATYFMHHLDSEYGILADNITHPFNEFILLAINFGIFGVIAIALPILFTIIRITKSDTQTKALSLTMLIAIFALSLFSYPLHYAVVWYVMAMAITPIWLNNDIIYCRLTKYLRIVVTIIMILLFSVQIHQLTCNLKWATISKQCLSGHTERMLPHYESLFPHMKHNPLFLYNYAAELNYIGEYKESLKITQMCLNRWNDYDVQLLLADNYANTGNIESAIQSYNKASYMIPCRFSPHYELMHIYLT